MSKIKGVTRKFLAGTMVLVAGAASGQDYPNKPIRMITDSAGGGSDYVARIVAQGISGPLGQQVIIDNRPTIIGAEAVSKAAPDGYTLLVNGRGFWILTLLQKAPYEVSDFAPISIMVREVLALAVHPSVPVKSVKELIAMAKARPGELNYSSGATGGTQHIGAELLKSLAGVNMVRVAYKGAAPAITALLSGEVQLTVGDAGLLAPHGKSGRLRILAATSAEPTVLAPGLPTVAASGVPGYEMVSMTCIFAPAKTPAAILNRVNQEVVRFLNRPEVKEKFLSGGAEVVGSSSEQFAATFKSELATWSKIIRDTGIKVD